MALLNSRGLAVEIAGTEVCRALDWTIDAGERWAVLGRNGSGKSTLLRTLAGLRAPRSGTVEIEGVDIRRLPRRRVARRLGVLFQHNRDLFPSTVLETALIGRHPYLDAWQWEGKEDLELAGRVLAEVDLAGMEDRAVATLSGGERQRLEIAALLLQDPALMLLDEPTNHLDLHHQIATLAMLEQRCAAGERALVMVLHDPNLAARFCDHALLLHGGGACEHGGTAEMLTAERLARLYGHPVRAIPCDAGPVFVPG